VLPPHRRGVIMLEEYSIKRLHEWIEAQLQAP